MINCGWKYHPEKTNKLWWSFQTLSCGRKWLVRRSAFPDRRKVLRDLNAMQTCYCKFKDDP